jgi:ribosomal protein L10
MKLTPKSYKLSEIKKYLKDKDILLIYLANDIQTKQFLKTKQKNKTKKLITYKPNKSLLRKYLQSTTISNTTPLATGSYLFVTFTNKTKLNKPFTKFFELNKTSDFLALKITNKVYTKPQLRHVPTLNYKNNVKLFHNCLNNTLKSFTLKLK